MINYYKFSLIISILAKITGAIFKIMHWPASNILFSIGVLVSLIFILIALMEIYISKEKSQIEKLLWLIGFIALSSIIGLIYYYSEIKPKYKNK